MERLVKSTSGSHWYKRDGEPCYEVPYADKKRAGEMRPATLRDARKMDLLPSVTTILGVISKPGLENWKIEQGMMAALTLPRLDDESEELFIKRLREDAVAYAKQAASLGTATHRACQRWLTVKEYSEITHGYETGAMLKAFADLWIANFEYVKFRVEVPFACKAGYGGKTDIKTDEIIFDIKTKNTKKGENIIMYPESGMQLAAYDRGFGGKPRRLINIVISTTEPGRIEMVEWTDKRDGLYKCFMDAFEVWKYLNNYDPTTGKE